MKAKLMKETEKAVQLSYGCEIYGEMFTVRNQWFPKSQITINGVQDGILDFEPKNDWILDAKTKDYCKYVASTFGSIKHEIKTYLSPINNVKVDYCWA